MEEGAGLEAGRREGSFASTLPFQEKEQGKRRRAKQKQCMPTGKTFAACIFHKSTIHSFTSFLSAPPHSCLPLLLLLLLLAVSIHARCRFFCMRCTHRLTQLTAFCWACMLSLPLHCMLSLCLLSGGDGKHVPSQKAQKPPKRRTHMPR